MAAGHSKLIHIKLLIHGARHPHISNHHFPLKDDGGRRGVVESWMRFPWIISILFSGEYSSRSPGHECVWRSAAVATLMQSPIGGGGQQTRMNVVIAWRRVLVAQMNRFALCYKKAAYELSWNNSIRALRDKECTACKTKENIYCLLKYVGNGVLLVHWLLMFYCSSDRMI